MDALTAAGLLREDGAKCAILMAEADLTGADAHGVFRLPQYVRRLKAGGFNAKPHITVTKSAPATALVDGDNGMGHLVMALAERFGRQREVVPPAALGIWVLVPLRAGWRLEVGIWSLQKGPGIHARPGQEVGE